MARLGFAVPNPAHMMDEMTYVFQVAKHPHKVRLVLGPLIR